MPYSPYNHIFGFTGCFYADTSLDESSAEPFASCKEFTTAKLPKLDGKSSGAWKDGQGPSTSTHMVHEVFKMARPGALYATRLQTMSIRVHNPESVNEQRSVIPASPPPHHLSTMDLTGSEIENCRKREPPYSCTDHLCCKFSFSKHHKSVFMWRKKILVFQAPLLPSVAGW